MACLLALFEAPLLAPFPNVVRAFWVAAGMVMTVPLAWRRQRPVIVWLVSSAAGAVVLATWTEPYAFGIYPGTAQRAATLLVMIPAPGIALYSVAAYCRPLRAWQALTGALAVIVLTFVALLPWLASELGVFGVPWRDGYRGTAERNAVIAAGILVAAWALGGRARARREAAAAKAGRDAAVRAETAERDRAITAGERARIARELHDITAHHVSVVALQAGAARLMAETGQPPGAEMLRAIEDASRQAMSEIRRALGVIRYSPAGSAPAPDAGQLPVLAERMRAAGLEVVIDGEAGPLPGGLGLAAYRVVQEGLTNVLRHSAARTATVTVRRADGHLEIVVADGGPARAGEPVTGPGGHGLLGLRERVTGFGGEVWAGPCPGDGFELCARLPLPDAPAGPDWPVAEPAGAERAGTALGAVVGGPGAAVDAPGVGPARPGAGP
jgi:signal transduction histidine kinase